MWGWIASFLSGPVLKLALGAYTEKLKASGEHDNKVVELAAREIELDATEARLNAQAKSEIRDRWYAPENLFAYAIALPYYFTVITLDYIVFPALGIEHVTGALKGETAQAMAMIMTFWLGKRALTSVASIIAGAFGKH